MRLYNQGDEVVVEATYTALVASDLGDNVAVVTLKDVNDYGSLDSAINCERQQVVPKCDVKYPMTCGTCGRDFPDKYPAGRCPYEYEHTPEPVDGEAVPEGPSVTITVTRSAGDDRAVLVFIDTDFEPNASDDGPGLRVLINDDEAYVGKAYEFGGDREAVSKELHVNLSEIPYA